MESSGLRPLKQRVGSDDRPKIEHIDNLVAVPLLPDAMYLDLGGDAADTATDIAGDQREGRTARTDHWCACRTAQDSITGQHRTAQDSTRYHKSHVEQHKTA